jgi:2-C-methyl-D-erythritol 4-phosphate cytidylyltransferase
MQHYAIILMAGQSQRFGMGDKCLAPVRGQPIVCYSLEAFRKAGIFDHYLMVYANESQKNFLENFLKKQYSAEELAKISWITGGPERMFSVFNALKFIHGQLHGDSFVFIHDGARPLISAENILHIDALLSAKWGVVLGHRVVDTIITIPSENNSQMAHPTHTITSAEQRSYPQRNKLWALETPQAYYFPKIFKDYDAAIHLGQHFTDDSSIFSGTIKILENHSPNLKITFPQDLEFLSKMI